MGIARPGPALNEQMRKSACGLWQSAVMAPETLVEQFLYLLYGHQLKTLPSQ